MLETLVFHSNDSVSLSMIIRLEMRSKIIPEISTCTDVFPRVSNYIKNNLYT